MTGNSRERPPEGACIRDLDRMKPGLEARQSRNGRVWKQWVSGVSIFSPPDRGQIASNDPAPGQRETITMSEHGLHHVTAFSGPALRNVDFYTRVLGLRLVKKTVNF